MSLKREVVFYPAWDHPRHGCHGAEMVFYVKGAAGVVQFKVFTNWHLPHVEKRLESSPLTRAILKPMAADLGYHSLEPMYEGQEPMELACSILEGRTCYYDGSTLNAEPVFKLLIEKGSEAVWLHLEGCYLSQFGDEV